VAATGRIYRPERSKLAHLDGLNLSRAWMLEGIASCLPKSDKRIRAILAAADAHKRAALAAVTGEHYEVSWLGKLYSLSGNAAWDPKLA